MNMRRTMKKKLKPRRNRTHKMYGGFDLSNLFGNRTSGLSPRALQSPKDTTLPFMYFYNFKDKEIVEDEENKVAEVEGEEEEEAEVVEGEVEHKED